MEFPASRLIGKRVGIAFRCNEQRAAQSQLVKIGEAEITEVQGDWMFVKPARWTGPVWVNLNHVLYLDLDEGNEA